MIEIDSLVPDLRAIIFDMDGVLVNSMPYHAMAWQGAFQSQGIEVDKKLFFEMEGMDQERTIKEVFEMLNESVSEEVIDRIGDKKTEITDEKLETRIFEETSKLLPKLGEKYKLGVVSGSTRYFVNGVIENHFSNCFDVVVAGGDTDENKPSPDPYLKASEKLDLPKEGILVVENAPLGVESAKRAGLTCLAVSTYIPKDKLEGADLVLESHEELVDFLEKGL